MRDSAKGVAHLFVDEKNTFIEEQVQVVEICRIGYFLRFPFVIYGTAVSYQPQLSEEITQVLGILKAES